MPDVVDIRIHSGSKRQPRPAELATEQGGPISREQLLALGVTPGAIKSWLRSGRLHCYLRNVYLLGHEAVTVKGRMLAPVLAYAPGAVLSHRSAAMWWGFSQTARSKVDVTVPGRTRRKQDGIDLHLVRTLDPLDTTEHDGVPITTVPRTLLDLAEVVPPRHLGRAVNEAERLRLFDAAAMEELVARSPGRRGLKPLRDLLSDFLPEPHLRSEFERLFREFCIDFALPVPDMNVDVLGYEVDAHWPGTNLIVELDSRAFHLNPKAFEEDRRRDAALMLAGYRVLRVTFSQLTREPNDLAMRISRLLADPQPSLPSLRSAAPRPARALPR
jgi:uncharacterized protein DUF559